MRETTKDQLTNWIVAFLFWALIFCLALFLRMDFSAMAFSDAFFASSMVELLGLALFFIGRFGTFDVLSYSMRRLFESFRPDHSVRWKTLSDYAEYKKEKRKVTPRFYLPLLSIGLTSFFLSLLFLILDYSGVSW
jgi:hypothetical protein